MEQEKQRQIKNLVVKAFNKIGNGLGDLLYDEEVTLGSLHRNTNIEIDHDFLTDSSFYKISPVTQNELIQNSMIYR
jgi:hypothetical protein